MSEQKILEFRERAERLVTPPDPGMLLGRGRAVRRRRQLAPVLALAVCGAIGMGIATNASDGGDAPSNIQPADQTPGTDSRRLDGWEGHMPPGVYTVDGLSQDGSSDVTVELVGERWLGWAGGARIESRSGTVSWGINQYRDAIIDPCTDRHATSMAGAVSQLSDEIPGRVTKAARPATALGLSGTYLQLSVPAYVDCGSGDLFSAYLMAIWPGPDDPRVTVDVWLLEDGDRLLILTRGVRGNPPAEMLDTLDRTLDTLRLVPAP